MARSSRRCCNRRRHRLEETNVVIRIARDQMWRSAMAPVGRGVSLARRDQGSPLTAQSLGSVVNFGFGRDAAARQLQAASAAAISPPVSLAAHIAVMRLHRGRTFCQHALVSGGAGHARHRPVGVGREAAGARPGGKPQSPPQRDSPVRRTEQGGLPDGAMPPVAGPPEKCFASPRCVSPSQRRRKAGASDSISCFPGRRRRQLRADAYRAWPIASPQASAKR